MSKNSKILAAAATLAISASISTGAIVNTTNTNAKKVENTKLLVNNRLAESTNNLQNTIIQQYGNTWSNWNVGFDTNTMKLTVPLASGNAIDPNFGEYMQYQLLSSDHKVLNTLNLKGTDGTGKVYELRQFSFKYGDILKITGSQLSFNKILVNGKETYNAFPVLPYLGYPGLESVYFEITPNGLIPMTGGFKTINGQTYYFNNNGIMANNGWFVSENGKTMTTAQAVSTPNTSSGYKSYYFNTQGEMAKGLTNIGGSYYYFNPDTGVMEIGLQTINGNIYYFNPNNGQMLTNIWVNINSQGQRTSNQVNGTTIQAYYLGANGVAEKGLQTIDGNIQYLNPETGSMELNKFITVDGNTYYLQPNNGVAATGWQTINGHKYYFNSNGIMQTGAKEIDGKVYDFGSNGILQGINSVQINGANNTSINFGVNFNPMKGITLADQADPNAKISVSGTVNTKVPGTYKLTYTVKDSYGETATATREVTVLNNYTVSINGANNESINVGTKFNPMEGVTLSDPADSTAKIQVEGTVNTKVPGVYKLTYTVKDNYEKTATVIREITVQNNTNTKSNTEDLYWNGDSLVINGNISSDSTFTHSTAKKLVIMNSEGQVVDSVNTAAVNWYSSNKDNYSGFQGILPASMLSKLASNESYNLYVEANDHYIPLISNSNNPYNKTYLLSTNSSNQLTLEKNDGTMKTINEGTGSYIVGYFINNGYVINGNISLNNEVFSKGNTRVLLVKNAEGKVVDSINCAAMNWYSSNKDNYSSFQGIIPNSVLNKLGAGDSYTLSLEVVKDGQTYEMPINNTKHFILSNGVKYDISTNSKNNITITKAQSYPVVNEGTSSLQSGYWEPYGYVMNIKTDIGKEIPKGTKMELISKNLNGQIVSVTPGVDVNWYSSNKDNYNGFQAMITSKQLVEASASNKLYVRVTIDGKTYESPVTGNLDTFGTGNLHYGFKTINNQINLIMK